MSKYSVDQTLFDNLTPEKVYFITWIAGDGNVRQNYNALRLEVKKEDIAVPIYFRDTFFPGRELYCRTRPEPKKDGTFSSSAELSVSGRLFVYNFSKKFNIPPAKSLIARWPSNIPKEYISSALRGIFESDGCIYNGESIRYTITSGSLELLKDIQKIIKNYVGVASGGIYSRLNDSNKFTYDLSYGAINDILALYEFMYKNATVALNRKYILFHEIFDKKNIAYTKYAIDNRL